MMSDASAKHLLANEVYDIASARHVWAVESDWEPPGLSSNKWPPRSGQRQKFPELDRADWFGINEALAKIPKGKRFFSTVSCRRSLTVRSQARYFLSLQSSGQTNRSKPISFSVDWNSVFVPAIGLAEIIVRGSLMPAPIVCDGPTVGVEGA